MAVARVPSQKRGTKAAAETAKISQGGWVGEEVGGMGAPVGERQEAQPKLGRRGYFGLRLGPVVQDGGQDGLP